MANRLQGTKVAIVVTDGFEEVELTEPKKALEAEGAIVEIVSPKEDKVKGWRHTEWGNEIDVDTPIAEADPADYDALVLPGGVMNPDKLRIMPEVQDFVKSFFDVGKPVAAICHGPWTLINAGVAQGRKLTSWPTLRSDLLNAGADWVDEEVVVDDGLVTSRKPDDIPAFNEKMIDEFSAAGPRGRADRRVPRAPAPV